MTAVLSLMALPAVGQPSDGHPASGPALLLTVPADPSDPAAGTAVDLVDDQGRRRLAPAPASAPTVNPSGTAVATITAVPDGDGSSGPVRITSLDGEQVVMSPVDAHGSLAWAPDGSAVLATTEAGVVAIATDSGAAVAYPTSNPGDRLLDAGEGTALVARPRSGETPTPEPVLLHADGRTPVLLRAAEGVESVQEGRIAPDGTQVAFTTQSISTGFRFRVLWFAASDGTSVQFEIRPATSLLRGNIGDLAWTPDGTGVLAAAVADEWTLMVRAPGAGPDGAEDGPGDRDLTTFPLEDRLRAVGWSADGALAVHALRSPDGVAVRAIAIGDGATLGLGTYPGAVDVVHIPGREGPPTELLVAGPVDRAVSYALAWSARFADGTVSTVLIGRPDGFADSLASGGGQGVLDAPLLLTPAEALDDRVAAELDRLGADDVVLLGGEAAISAAVAETLTETGFGVRRVAGPDRTATAVAMADLLAEITGAPPEGLVLARAFDDPADPTRAWADSLAAGARAAALRQPVLLTDSAALSPATADYLQSLPPQPDGAVRTVTIAGGPSAIAEPVAEEVRAIGLEVERLAGENRFASAVALAIPFGAGSGTVHVIDGTDVIGWAAGFPATGGQVVLVDGARVPSETEAHLRAIAHPANQVVCGPGLAEATCAQVTALGTDEGSG